MAPPLPITFGAASARGFGLYSAPAAITGDPYFEYVTMLLHGNGTNGAQNNTFLDSSTNAFSITRNGNTTQGTLSSFSRSNGNWSNYFGGSGSYLNNTSSAIITQNVSTFTVEGWVYLTANPGSDVNNVSGFITLDGQANNTTNYLSFGPISSRVLYLRWFDGSAKAASGSTALALNQWNHIACVVNSNSIQFYVNGVAETMSGTTTLTNRSGSSGQFAIGGNNYGNTTGYISNLRVTTTAVYTSAFTPPTTPLTAIANTSLLACQSNLFKDNSTNNYSLTSAGTVFVQPFNPFNPTAAYSTTANGGSGYFDGSGDYLVVVNSSTCSNFGTSDFTVELWVYFNSVVSSQILLDFRVSSGDAAGALYLNSSAQIAWYASGANRIVSSAVVARTWYHIALARSGTSTKLFINGLQSGGGTFTDSNNYIGNTNRPVIGELGDGTGSLPLNAFMSGLRIVKGTAVYTADFTPPTAPPTAITNTSLLLNYTNGGVFDSAAMNDLETVGNAQISTTQSKFGGSSMYFDGTGDYLSIPPNNALTPGTGDFTFECWAYISATGVDDGVLWEGRASGSSNGLLINTRAVSGGYKVNFFTGSSNFSSATVSYNTWVHIAATRSGSTCRLFINGTLDTTFTSSTDLSNNPVRTIGQSLLYANSNITGYINDLRFTNGYARYTASFTPPTAAFPDF